MQLITDIHFCQPGLGCLLAWTVAPDDNINMYQVSPQLIFIDLQCKILVVAYAYLSWEPNLYAKVVFALAYVSLPFRTISSRPGLGQAIHNR